MVFVRTVFVSLQAAVLLLAALVSFHQDGVTLRVSDDGAGFDPARVPGHREGHFGLQGMRERVKRLGGRLRIDSAPGGGTRIEVSVLKQAFGSTV